MPNAADPTKRFSNRVDNYIRYRPTYPPEVVTVLEQEAGLHREHVIADIGSGTGISTRLFLDHGNSVFAVEPNPAMRQAAETSFAGNARFHSVNGTAEQTSLAANSIDFVVAGQAFHWFDQTQARVEFSRILRPSGWVLLMWNTRRTDTTTFLSEYEHLISEFGIDYRQVNHRNIDQAKIQSFFAPAQFRYRRLDHVQKLDCAGLIGRLASSSYMPAESDPRFVPMSAAVEELFQRHAHSGQVEIDYDTELYFGQINVASERNDRCS